MKNVAQIRRESVEKYGPEPVTAEERLAHVLAVYADEPDTWMVVEGTNNMYGDGVRTGLTMGDLRELHTRLAGE
ncbi:hypothetical protein [Streptomyces nanshensis]|uniref:Uncharacterized protein n=1 Tax=Streptomyces nanshensis TaxID=518642 RepID=A0A1E7L5Q3_9ACTN|nr:hypothetical protein [Streptomyces nanshensis]OEV11510.1 hypothetical protein AN218_12555 [Streptomyces nanshensis]